MKSVHKEPWIGDIPDEWKLKAIKRIVSTKVTDGPHETPELEDSGVQFISAEAIKNNRIDFNQRRGFISQELHEQYLLNSSGFLGFARKLAIPSVQQSNLNSTRYCRMLIPLPPRKEQEVICAHLDEELGDLKRVVAGIETQIATLTAYRKSLIHECVTGQRRITEADLKEVKAHG